MENKYETIEESIERLEEDSSVPNVEEAPSPTPEDKTGIRVVQSPNGAGLAALASYKKKMDDKCFQNFQTTRRLKTQTDSVSALHRINMSEYFRRCSEILVAAGNAEEAIIEVQKLAASLVFKKKSKGGRPKNATTGKVKKKP